ncbi:hypothetical protein CLIB1444_02S18778 [[Candida] jaroonii]|uniref:Uncharacterized protein n=1 Tax=[Candida] jaroonii TaxID=467808 RepID=A0ACA9Y4R2_9ASCO|nr:hypothetical protein CLIB1444_02S18778 [[Candida] jaroonii]
MTVSVKEWVPPQETSENLDWAELTIIDLSNFDHEKEKLAHDLREAVQRDGFWAITGSGISTEEINRHFALGDHFFTNYSHEDKAKQLVDFPNGNYFGFKPKGEKTIFGTQVLDNVETLNIPKFNGQYDDYYKQTFIEDFRTELAEFSRKSYEVGVKLLKLFAIILEIDEEFFVNNHLYSDLSDDHLRFMKYFPRKLSEDEKVEKIWARGHTDFGTLTLLYNQKVAGLQIKNSKGWKYVKPVEGGIICNIGDTLSFWSGGYFKSTIHRVIRPPEDQVNKPRIGAFYFFRPGDNTRINVVDSPLLKRLGLYKDIEPINGTEYVRKRVESYHNHQIYLKQDKVKFKFKQFEIEDGFE